MVPQKAEVPEPERQPRKEDHLLAFAEGALHAFEHMGIGALLLDPKGLVRKVNAQAKKYFGAGILIINGKPCATHRAAQGDLNRVIARATNGDTSNTMLDSAIALPRSNGRPLVARILRVRQQLPDRLSRPWPLLLLVDPDCAYRPEEMVLRNIFALTPAEARLAIGITGGQELSNVAVSLGIRLGTARVQLSNVFAKTGARNQRELAALLERLSRVSHHASMN